MSYVLIFDTKFVKCTDGSIKQLSLEGSSDNRTGRNSKDDLRYKVTSYDDEGEFYRYIRKLEKTKASSYKKVEGRNADNACYARYLRKNYGQAVSEEEFVLEYNMVPDNDGYNLERRVI